MTKSDEKLDPEHSRPPSRKNGEKIAVKCTLEAYDLSKVDTVNGRAYVKVGVIARWFDQRMIGKDEVPDNLWGPYVRLSNELEIRTTQVVFDIEDRETGLMKRLLIYTGLVKNSMNLRDFPVDISSVELNFRTSSDFMTRDFKRSGARATGQTYQLWWPDAAAERVRVRWPGDVHEWELIGISTELVHHAATSRQSYTPTSLGVYFHVKRMYSYYLLKALLPLWLTFGLSLAVFWYEPEHTEDRIEIVLNCFLAVISLLFVISTFLPVTSTLTIIDYVTLATLTALGLECVACLIVGDRMGGWALGRARDAPRDHAAMIALDTFHFYVVVVFYVGANLALLVPAVSRHFALIFQTFEKYKPPHPPRDAGHKRSSDLRFSFLAEPGGAAAARRLAEFAEVEELRKRADDPDAIAAAEQRAREYGLEDKDLNDLKLEITSEEVERVRALEGLSEQTHAISRCDDPCWHDYIAKRASAPGGGDDGAAAAPSTAPPPSSARGASEAGDAAAAGDAEDAREPRRSERPSTASAPRDAGSAHAPVRARSEQGPTTSAWRGEVDVEPLLPAPRAQSELDARTPPSPRRAPPPARPSPRAARGPQRAMTLREKRATLAFLEAEQHPDGMRSRAMGALL